MICGFHINATSMKWRSKIFFFPLDASTNISDSKSIVFSVVLHGSEYRLTIQGNEECLVGMEVKMFGDEARLAMIISENKPNLLLNRKKAKEEDQQSKVDFGGTSISFSLEPDFLSTTLRIFYVIHRAAK